MQPQNLPDPVVKTRLTIALAVGVIIFVIGLTIIIGLSIKHATQKATPSATPSNQHTDAASGEVVSDPEGKSPESYGTEPGAPTFLGLSLLLERGVTLDQLDDLKYGLYQFTKAGGGKIKELSLKTSSFVSLPYNSDTGISGATFELVADKATTYQARIDYHDRTILRVTLSDKAGKSLFDSGELDGRSID